MNFSVKLRIALLLLLLGPGIFVEALAQEVPRDDFKILIFLDPECPISQAYALTLRSLHTEYAPKGIVFLGVYDSAPLKRRDIRRFHRKYQLPFSGVKDKHYALAKRYDATITPEVVLVSKEDRVVYRGAIDNWYYALGKNRREPTEHYLKDAMEAVLEGNPVIRKQTQAVGCLMNR